MIIIIIGNWY